MISASQIKRYIRKALKGEGWMTPHFMWLNAPKPLVKGGMTKSSILSYAKDMKGVKYKKDKGEDYLKIEESRSSMDEDTVVVLESVRETLEAKDPYSAGSGYKAAALKLHTKYAKTRHQNPDWANIRHYLWTIHTTGKAPWNDLSDRIGKKKADKLRKELVDLSEARMSPSKWKISDDREGNVYLSLDGKKHLMTPGTAFAVATELKQYAKKHGVD